MANSHDPHRPFAGSEKKRPSEGATAASGKGYPSPGRIYSAEEITVPGFLPDLPDVRTEMAQYYSSAHRCDQTLGEVLRALRESGFEDNTLVMFVSDNGISMPFAKSNCYLTSTRTPWLVRWPGKVRPGVVDRTHFISGIDYMPTILEAAGVPVPTGMDGRSFMPLLTGGSQEGRDRVFTCYNENSGRRSYVMRCLQDKRFGYIYNAWVDGQTSYRTEPMSGLTFKAMQQAAAEQPAVAERVELLLHRVPEEFYDLQSDPSALHNLIADPKYQDRIQEMRRSMLDWMERTDDPVVQDFRARLAPSLAK
jgi:N-sulfoglucosamine sulfohydrolase